MDKNPSTILIADDERAMREALGELLIEEGYDVEFAKNGAEAVTKAREIVPDLVLLDVMMPDMDGFAACRALRADKLLAQVPIIMITSLGDRASRLKGFEAGADDYVSKPIDEPELLARVKTTTHLNRYRKLLEEQISREMAEKALQISEVRYCELFDRMPVGLYRSTPSGETLDANPALVEMLGYPDAETLLASNAIERYANPQDRQRWQAVMEQEEVVLGFEAQWQRYDGTAIWVQENARLVRDEVGQPLYYEGSVEDITKRIRSEQERAQAEEAYRALVDHSLQGLAILQDGRIVFANQALADIGSYTVEKLLAFSPQEAAEIIHPEDRETVLGYYQDQEAGKSGPEQFAFRIIQKDEAVRWVEVYASRIEYQGLPAVQTAYVDITERRQAQEALRESEENYRSVVDNANVGIVVIQEGKRVFHNARVPEILRYSEEEYQQVDFVTTIHPDDRELAIGNIRKRIQGEDIGSQGIEIRLVTKSGETRWVQANSSVIRWEGKPAIQAFIADITQRKQAEEALQESEEKYRNVIEYAHEAIVVIQDEMLKFSNPQTVELTGYSLDELASISLAELVHPDDRAAGFEHQRRRLEGEKIPPLEVTRIIDKQGNIKWVENNSIVITWEEKPATLHFVNDITERVRSEQERAEAEKALRESEGRHRMLFETMTQGVLYWNAEGRVVSANPAAERILGLTLDQIQGKAPIDPRWKMVSQDGSEIPEERLLAIVSLRPGEEMHNVTIGFFNPELDSYRWVNLNAVPLFRSNESKPYRVHTIFEDITERVQAEAEIKQRNEELAALNEIGQAIVSTLELQETLTTITDHTTRLMGMAATSVTLVDKANEDLYFAAASGEGSGFIVGQQLVPGQGVVGWVIEHGEPALIPDVSQDDRWDSRLDAEGGFTTRSILCVPLKSKGRVIGALEAINKEYGFTQDDLHLLNALVAPVSTAIENARLFEQVRVGREQLQTLSRRLVEMQEAERAHVARELHDETGQALSSILLNLGLLEQEADQPDTVIARTTEMIVIVDDMLGNLHRLAMNLRPATLDHLGLIPALEQYIETFNQQYSIKTQFETVGLGEKRLPPEVETALYRIVQESLTNVVRHAQATQADVLVERRNDQVVTIVEDNGTGFDPETAMQTSRLGLLGMRERAEMLNGKLVIESAPGAGTTVLVEVPYITA